MDKPKYTMEHKTLRRSEFKKAVSKPDQVKTVSDQKDIHERLRSDSKKHATFKAEVVIKPKQWYQRKFQKR